jgi:hypothetical protein
MCARDGAYPCGGKRTGVAPVRPVQLCKCKREHEAVGDITFCERRDNAFALRKSGAAQVSCGSKPASSLRGARQLPPVADMPISSRHRRESQVRASHTSLASRSNTAKPAVSFRASWSEWLGLSRGADACACPERVWLQPRYRGLAHTIGARQISLRNALHKPLDNFLALMDGKHRRPAKTHPTGFSAGSTLTGAGLGSAPSANSKRLDV